VEDGMTLDVKFAVAKIKKYASRESGDTLEMVERPHGGLSLVLVDGQRSGRSAKVISNVVARKAIQLLGEGVRDGAAARAANDYLYTYRGGKVTATLNIVSVDAVTRTIVVSRNNESPVLLHTVEKGVTLLDKPSRAVGVRRNTKPVISEIPLVAGTVLVAFTDGLRHAGTLNGLGRYDYEAAFRQMVADGPFEAQSIANTLLAGAMKQEKGRPRDDISVLVLSVAEDDGNPVRTMGGRLLI
jgi:serine phosphatase RsbU (regulator of sigma subunit)